MPKVKKVRFGYYIISSFVLAFIFNLVINGNDMAPMLGYLYGDINAVNNMNTFDIAKIFGVIILETGVLSYVFYYISKKVF